VPIVHSTVPYMYVPYVLGHQIARQDSASINGPERHRNRRSSAPVCGNDKRQAGLGIWLHINPVSCRLPNLPQFPVACYLSCGRRFRPGRAFYPTALIYSTFGRPLVEQLLWRNGCGSVSRTRLNPIRAVLLPSPGNPITHRRFGLF
jgi:hypothetical protein